MKSIARKIIASILSWQVVRLRKQHDFKIIGVVGSVGKTSTKLAIAQTLGVSSRVQYQHGNYNDYISVPLVLFGQDMPSLFNPFGWLMVLLKNESIIRRAYPYDYAVLELGTDSPGQIGAFEKYLQLDVAVVTAISPEHMEFFTDINAVALEELSVTKYADAVLINKDLVSDTHRALASDAHTYAIGSTTSNYGVHDLEYTTDGAHFSIRVDKDTLFSVTTGSFADAQIYSLLAAASIADLMGIAPDDITRSLQAVKPVPGRMQLLAGIRGSKIIDDSYNASPEAVKSVLETVYRITAPQKIAVLGTMNELGDMSMTAHIDIGEFCDKNQLDEVVTIGEDANKYLARSARAKGCKVTEFDSPYEAGEYIKSVLRDNALVLIKGSQNRVFAEEAIKILLADTKDVSKLVRQSNYWLKQKASQFTPGE